MLKSEEKLTTSENLKAGFLTVFLAAAILYAATCAPGSLWQDSGRYQYRIFHNDIEGKLGLALSHPLFHIIGIAVKHIPVGEFAYRINLMAALAGAITVANLFLLLRLWLGTTYPAVIAAVTLALSHTFWRHCVIAETYTLYTALFSAELLMLLQYIKTKRIRFLYLLGLFNGLAIASHMWAILAFTCYAVFAVILLIKKQIRLKHLAITAILWIVGASPYIFLIIKNMFETGDLSATVASAFFGKSWQDNVLNFSLSATLIKENLLLIAYNFPTLNFLFFFTGLYGIKRASPGKSFKNILLALLIIYFVFAFRYTVPDRYVFFIPFYFLVSVLLGVGLNTFFKRFNKPIFYAAVTALALLPIPVYFAAPAIAQKMNVNISTKRELPFRNNYTWFLQPWKTSENSAQLFANSVFKTLEDNAAIYADGTTAPPLLYLQDVKQKRPDVDIISTVVTGPNKTQLNEMTIKKMLDARAFYVVSPIRGYCPSFLLRQYDFVREGVIWRVVEKKQSKAACILK